MTCPTPNPEISPTGSITPEEEKAIQQHISHVESGRLTNSNGLSEMEKQQDGTVTDTDFGSIKEPPMTFRRAMSLVAMGFMWVGSQIPAYLWGAVPPIVYGEIGGVDRWVWYVTGYLLGLAGICPFVGALSDLLGRRYVAVLGLLFVIVGQIICSTAQNMNPFIAGNTLSGIGAGVCELTALAGTSELAPTRKRGLYVSILVFTILPFCPSVMWAQLIAAHSGWRNIGWLTGAWNVATLLMVLFFYFPPPRVNSAGLSRQELLARIDYVGGFLSISGIVLFVAGILWGGYQYPWTSAHTLVPLFLGVVLFTAFVFWEIYGAEYPMYPRRLGQATWNLTLTFVITFVSGANFFSVLMLWPTQAYNVYGHHPVGVGLRGLPFGLSVMVGACICLALMTATHGQIKWLLFGSSVLMTAGCGSLAAARVDNMSSVYGFLVLAGLGVGGIVVPASILSTIICPDDLIATISALTLSIRVIGGAVGYTIYYNVFYEKVSPLLKEYVVEAMVSNGITNMTAISEVVTLLGASLTQDVIYYVDGNQTVADDVIRASQMAYSLAYPWVFYCSIAFGVVSIAASLFIRNRDVMPYMTNHVAVVIA